MNYYKVNINTPLGVKLKSLLAEVLKGEIKADDLAEKIGAVAYVGAADVDFGGISAFEFPDDRLPDLSLFERIEQGDGIRTWYVPKVEVKEQPMLSEVAVAQKGGYGKVVPETEKTFREMSFLFSRSEAAALAGITLTEPAVEEVLRGLKISPAEMRMLRSGDVNVQTLFPECEDDTPKRVARSLAEDKQIMEVLANRKFRMVITIVGNRKAVQLYKQMLSLPTVPQGMTSALLSIDNPKSRPGIAEFDGHIYVCSGTPTTGSEPQEVSEEEFLRMKNVLESSAEGNVVAQA